MPVSDGLKTTVSGGNNTNDTVRASNDPDGSLLKGLGGDDIMKGGRYDDDITGGAGDDVMSGGDGADRFRFYGNTIEGSADYDRIFDLDFSEGDTLFLANYGVSFTDAAGADAINGGNAVEISSFDGIEAVVNASGGSITASLARTNNLLLTIDNGSGLIQEVEISNAWDDYLVALSS